MPESLPNPLGQRRSMRNYFEEFLPGRIVAKSPHFNDNSGVLRPHESGPNILRRQVGGKTWVANAKEVPVKNGTEETSHHPNQILFHDHDVVFRVGTYSALQDNAVEPHTGLN